MSRTAKKRIEVRDEGAVLVLDVDSIDFTGAGVSGSAVGNDVEEAVAGGASGITEISATGAINGVNATFTFAQKPLYIVSDGATYKENKGWTWSGLTATMTIPPTYDIYGII